MSEARTPLVGIVMGSDSDFKVMVKAAEIFDVFEVPYEMLVASAHRTPDLALGYAEKAKENGLRAIIAGAGAAAHLPGVLAAKTTLPVIGVPLNATALQGTDALYAICQMPSGIPVATMAIDGSKNAALFAIQILATADVALAERFAAYKRDMAQAVATKNKIVQEKLKHYKEVNHD